MSYRSLSSPGLAAFVVLALSAAQPPALIAQEQDAKTQARDSLITGVPEPLGGTSPQLLPTSEREVRNLLRGGVTLGTLYDDNALNVNGQLYHGYQYSVLPSLAFQRTRLHTAWIVDYRGGFTVDQKAQEVSPSIQYTSSATADMQHVFARRLLLDLREDYVRTTNPFGYTGQIQSLAAVSGTGELNSFVAAPAATRIAEVSSGNMTYQLSRHSSMGFSGSYAMQRFRDVAAATGAALSSIDTRTTAGRGFYALQISQRHKIGFEYQLQDLRFQGNAARTVDQTILLFDEITFRTNLTLTLYAGPDDAHIHNNILRLASDQSTSLVPLITDVWSPGGGAVFTWRGRSFALAVSGQRLVTDGSGSTGTVRATSARADLRKEFTNRWSLSLGYLYSDARLLVGSASTDNSRIRVQQGTLVLERRLSPSVVVRAQYARIQQLSSGTPAPLTTGNHNRGGVELAYEFVRPLGR